MSLWKISINEQYKNSPQLRVQKHKPKIKETSLCTFHKASLTIEATIVLPVVLGVLVTILFFFRIIQVQMTVEEGLIYAGRKTAVESSIVDSEIVQYASAKAFLLEALTDEAVIEKYVEGGSAGVVLLGSNFWGNDIVLKASYHVNFPIRLFEFGGVTLWSQHVFRKWVGDIYKGGAQEDGYVYVTPEGEVYHATKSCRAIKLSLNRCNLFEIQGKRGENGQKYYPCMKCMFEESMIYLVYYTDYGTFYHADLNCSSIKRTITKTLLSEVENRRKCSFCY